MKTSDKGQSERGQPPTVILYVFYIHSILPKEDDQKVGSQSVHYTGSTVFVRTAYSISNHLFLSACMFRICSPNSLTGIGFKRSLTVIMACKEESIANHDSSCIITALTICRIFINAFTLHNFFIIRFSRYFFLFDTSFRL